MSENSLSAAPPSRSAGCASTSSRVRWGEELPVFCEKCGYALHGLPPRRCADCQLLHFACPECGHHQPINTLRPAAQRILGRFRAWYLVVAIVARLGYFGLGWVVALTIGHEVNYTHKFFTGPNGFSIHYQPVELSIGAVLATAFWSAAFGGVGRLLLLRWSAGWAVGAGIALTTGAAALLGAAWRYAEITSMGHTVICPVSKPFLGLLAIMTVSILLAAVMAWPVWWLVVHLVLPAPLAERVLAWMTYQADADALARSNG